MIVNTTQKGNIFNSKFIKGNLTSRLEQTRAMECDNKVESLVLTILFVGPIGSDLVEK